jgi:hypothetical protein
MDRDIAIASTIARGEAFALDVIDKECRIVIDPAEFSEIVARSYLAADGYCRDGLFNSALNRSSAPRAGPVALYCLTAEVVRSFETFLPLRPTLLGAAVALVVLCSVQSVPL